MLDEKLRIKNSPLFPHLEKADFLKRSNRFVILCLYKRKKIKAFLPNPGRLWELLLPGARLYLERSASLNRQIPYTVVAIERDGYPIMVHTHRTNDIVEFLINKNLIPGLAGIEVIQREYRYGRSRFDFLLRQGTKEIVLEVKSCTLYGKQVAMFPDAVTTRGRKHIQELKELKKKGKEGAILFLVFSPHCQYFLPEYHTDPEFSQALWQAKDEISIFPIATKLTYGLKRISEVKLLKIPWQLLEQENKNRGSYILILHLPISQSLIIGKLGLIYFPSGYYLYVGSAANNLQQRIVRHWRPRKKLFWHIDYLRAQAQFYKAIPIRISASIECDLAQALQRIAAWEVPNFGSSDCSCRSHLFGMDNDPLSKKEFISLLQYFRMDRILEKQI